MAPKVTYADGSTPRICIVGAGPAGLCTAVQLKRKLQLGSFVVYERASDFGGVWLTNTYPGCQVDIPGFAYCYSFEPNLHWSALYPGRDEVLAYFQRVARKYDIYSHAQFETEVISADWNKEKHTWSVTTTTTTVPRESTGPKEVQVEEFDIVIIGTGPLREPNYPAMFDNFQGPKMHSAAWNSKVQLADKVVGVVGCGASAVQVIPSIAPMVRELVVYMREPTHIWPKVDVSTRRFFSCFPCLLPISRAAALLALDMFNDTLVTGSLANRLAGRLSTAFMKWNVRDEAMREKLTPNHDWGAKAPKQGLASYFKTFSRANVKLIRSQIEACEGSSVKTTDGCTQNLDVLILCTGFKLLDFFAPMRISGVNGVDLLNLWKSGQPCTFYGITCNEAPNLFFLLGPNGFPGVSGVLFNIECQTRFIIHAVRALMKLNASSIRPSVAAQVECMAEINEAARNKVYMQTSDEPHGKNCETWLQTENGFPTLWPGTNRVYWLRTRRLDYNKFEFTYKEMNRIEKKIKKTTRG